MSKAKADAKATDNRLKRKGAGTGTKQSKKAAKDLNKPKRPPSAFFVFMAEFREQYKKDHPNNKSVAAVGKACGEKWKTMSDAAPYVVRAEKKKEEYDRTIQAYNRKLEAKNNGEEYESDKSKSEINDEEEDEEEEDGDDDDDDDDE